jgi:nitric oxide reductase NorQ protein
MSIQSVAAPLDVPPELPFYRPAGGECELFQHAYRNRLPLLLKGPTGCGKTRFVAYMAARLGRPLYTVSCHSSRSDWPISPKGWRHGLG